MSDLLKQQCSFAKLRKKLEERKEKLCRHYKGFGHLAQNYRNREGEEKGKAIPQNKFEVLSSQVMQYGVEERAMCVARPQNVQQEKRLVHFLWRKA